MVWSVFLTVLHLKTLLLIGCEFSTANQKPANKWFLMATQREKRYPFSSPNFLRLTIFSSPIFLRRRIHADSFLAIFLRQRN